MVKNGKDGSGPTGGSDAKFKGSVRDLALNAAIAALYFALTVALEPISFGSIQFRVSEVLILIAFWRKDLWVGLTIGCVFANAFSFSYWDILIGSMATLISALLMSYASPRIYIAVLWPIVLNGLFVGAELTWIYPSFPEYWQNALSVMGGEALVMVLAYVLWILLARNKAFMGLIRPNRHAAILY